MAKNTKKGKGLWQEFKEFINKGNALMLAIGVVIGGAFSAIVTAFVNILMNLASWPLPGGLTGLVTPLYPLPWAAGQRGLGAGAHLDIGLDQSFKATELQDMAKALATKLYGEAYSDVQFVDAKNTITSNYTLYGRTYIYNQCAYINWGALINAFISFLIVALVLFIIVKVISVAAAKKAELDARMQEEYYKKHPEERPVPPEPGEPEPTEIELLKEIRDALVKKDKPKEKPAAEKAE